MGCERPARQMRRRLFPTPEYGQNLNESTTLIPYKIDDEVLHGRSFWTPEMLKRSIVGFFWVSLFWQLFLLIRQMRVLQTNVSMPLKLKRILDPSYYTRARLYRLDRVRFTILQTILTHAYTLVCCHMSYGALTWKFVWQYVQSAGWTTDTEMATSLICCFLLALINGIGAIPWDIYATFYIQVKHGISKQAFGCYLRETFKGMLINQLATVPMVGGLLYIVRHCGANSFFIFWGARCLLNVLRETFYMSLIAPHFQKVYPLPTNRLRSAVESLSASIGFPLKELYVLEISQYTTISNAHIAGVFRGKSIILFDTLLKHEVVPYDESKIKHTTKSVQSRKIQFSRGPKDGSCRTKNTHTRRRFPDEDVLAIVCHEIGHWKMSHVPMLFVLAEMDNLLNHLIVSLTYQWPILFKAFGFEGTPIFAGIVLSSSLLLSPFSCIMSFIRTWFKRSCEIQADKFVHQMRQGPYMEKAIITMNMDSLSFPLYDPLYNAWHNSHPPLPQRIEILRGDYTGASGLANCHLQPSNPAPVLPYTKSTRSAVGSSEGIEPKETQSRANSGKPGADSKNDAKAMTKLKNLSKKNK